MMINAIGRPTPTAPPIIAAKAESKLAPACNSRNNMPWLHEPPQALPIPRKMND